MAICLFVISYIYPTHAAREAMAVAVVFFTGISKIPPRPVLPAKPCGLLLSKWGFPAVMPFCLPTWPLLEQFWGPIVTITTYHPNRAHYQKETQLLCLQAQLGQTYSGRTEVRERVGTYHHNQKTPLTTNYHTLIIRSPALIATSTFRVMPLFILFMLFQGSFSHRSCSTFTTSL